MIDLSKVRAISISPCGGRGSESVPWEWFFRGTGKVAELPADDVDVVRSFDTDRNPITRNSIHDEPDVVADQDLVANLAAEYKHEVLP